MGLRFSFIYVYMSSNILLYRPRNTVASCALRFFSQACGKETEPPFAKEATPERMLSAHAPASCPHLQYGLPAERGAADIDHAHAGNRGRRSVLNIVHLEQELTIGGHGDAVSVG